MPDKKTIIPIIHPQNTFLSMWDIFIIINIIISMLYIPYKIVFDFGEIGGVYAYYFILYSIDIFLGFHIAVKRKTEYVFDHETVKEGYLKKWFVKDFIAAFPFGIIAVLLYNNGFNSGIAAFILNFTGLILIAKGLKFSCYIKKFEDSISINPAISRLMKFLFMVLIISHWLALGWINVGPQIDGGITNIDKYLRAIYWCITTISTVGYGDISPDLLSNSQILYTMFSMILGVGIYGYVIGNVASLLANIDVAKANFIQKMEEINSFIRKKNLPIDLAHKINNYYDYLWESQQGGNDSKVMNEFPHSLKIDVSLFLNKKIVQKVPFFSTMGEVFIREIVTSLEPAIFLPNDYILRKGAYGSSMFFLAGGTVNVTDENQNILASLGEGAFFGEMSLIQGEKRNANIVATDYCDVYRLTKERFDDLREKYPEFDHQVVKTVKEREEMNRKKAAERNKEK